MPWRNFPMGRLLLVVSLAAVSSCAGPRSTLQSFPSASELQVEPRPVPTVDILTSEAAADDYQTAVETWGDRGWQAVNRLCIWAKASGMKDAPC